MAVKILKFSAEWCAPCKMMQPIFTKISTMEEFKNIEFKSYDIENDEKGIELVNTFNIKNIPTIVILDNDDIVLKKIIGAINEKELIEIIKDSIKYAI